MNRATADKSRGGRRGAALPLVVGLLVVLTLIGSGLLASALAGRTEAVRRQQSLQCFWGAESALAVVRERLYHDAAYREQPLPVSLTNGPMVADATVVRSGQVFTVTARGSNLYARLSRRLQQIFTMEMEENSRPWSQFALLVGSNGCDLSQSVTIAGDVFCEGSLRMSQAAVILEHLFCRGDLTMSQSAAIYNEAFVGGTISTGQTSIVYGGSYPFSSPANPYAVPLTVPQIDWAWYQSMVAQAAVQDSGLNFSQDINLANQVWFVRGAASLGSYRRIYSDPPGGVLVVRDSLTLQQSAQVGSNVTIICGTVFAMGQNTRVGQNSLIYAGNQIQMKQSGIVASRCSLITPGTIEMKQAAQASGFIYAGNLLDISQSTTISGLAFAGLRAQLSQGVMITYAPTMLPVLLPPGLVTNSVVSIIPSQWREL